MPRPKPPGAPEPKRRSRNGCWACKSKKVKCGEEKPRCLNCERNGEPVCDYSIRLNWDGRLKRKGTSTLEPGESSASTHTFAAASSPTTSSSTFSIPESSRASQPFPSRPSWPESEGSSSHALPSESTQAISPFEFAEDPSHAQRPMPPPLPLDPTGRNPSFDFGYPAATSTRPQTGKQKAPAYNQYGTEGLEHAHFRPHLHPVTSATSPYVTPAVASTPGSSIGLSEGSGGFGFPPTPSASSVTSEELQANVTRTSPHVPPSILNPRRLSVNSLIMREESNAEKAFEYYGIDRGFPDLDLPNNDDSHALDINTPVLSHAHFRHDQRRPSIEFGFGSSGDDRTATDSCYAEPLHVKISTSLAPLPSLLLESPINLMYFHFFLEYTARILVPHDCPANSFRVILPQMAVRDENLLKLLLAYSASHRARVLNHPLPSNRIAIWVSEVFPSLRRALEQPPEQISDANVAAAIMLASLEIIAPNTFGVGVAWQAHLGVARRMILARGGARAVNWRRDRVAYFLVRWFAYLDVLGSFTSTGLTAPRAGGASDAMFTADLYDFGRENDFQIDCLLGFPGRLAGLLAAIADLARACDARRAQSADTQAWRPDPATVTRARQIYDELHSVRAQPYTLCPHRAAPASPASTDWEAAEMAATNEAFHAAGLLHLYRRVLNRPRADPDVQGGVRAVVAALQTVRPGGAAEACLLFPLFTAGCEAREQGQRDVLVERVQSMERSGMTQVQRARRILELVWQTGRPWEQLIQGEEFFG